MEATDKDNPTPPTHTDKKELEVLTDYLRKHAM